MMTYPCWQASRNGPGHFSGRGFQEWNNREIKLVNGGVVVSCSLQSGTIEQRLKDNRRMDLKANLLHAHIEG
jgi:hypothetical protein